MRIFSAMHPAYRSLRIQLGQKGRDDDIEQYRTFLRSCGRLGIPLANYDFHPGNTYTTATVRRRAYTAREFNLKDFRSRVEKQRFARKYEAKDIWEYYTYFFRAVLPVAEKADVKLGLHPDDPPLAMMNGVAKIFTHLDGYRRAEELAGKSRHWGLTFCIGTWSEGGRASTPAISAWMRRGVVGSCTSLTPSASAIALATHAGTLMQLPSARPFAPSGVSGDGVS